MYFNELQTIEYDTWNIPEGEYRGFGQFNLLIGKQEPVMHF